MPSQKSIEISPYLREFRTLRPGRCGRTDAIHNLLVRSLVAPARSRHQPAFLRPEPRLRGAPAPRSASEVQAAR